MKTLLSYSTVLFYQCSVPEVFRWDEKWPLLGSEGYLVWQEGFEGRSISAGLEKRPFANRAASSCTSFVPAFDQWCAGSEFVRPRKVHARTGTQTACTAENARICRILHPATR